MCEGYVLEWLDTLVTVTLNPAKSKIDVAVPVDIAKIKDQVICQKNKVQTAIKSTVFNLNDEAKIRCLIKKYHSSLITLLDQALEDLALIKNSKPLREVLDTIIACIDELLSLIEHRFTSYLSIDERVPATYPTVQPMLSLIMLPDIFGLKNMKSSNEARMLDLIGQWQQSGLSQKAWCLQQNIAYSAFQYWHRRLKKLQHISDPESGNEFVQLMVKDKLSLSPWCELILDNQKKICFHQPVSASFLRSLLD